MNHHIFTTIYEHIIVPTLQVSVRSLRSQCLDVAGDFQSMVMHEVTIDLRRFRLPGKLEDVKFRFVNPLWAWVSAANDI